MGSRQGPPSIPCRCTDQPLGLSLYASPDQQGSGMQRDGKEGGRGGDLLNNQSGQGQCPAAPPDFPPGLLPVSPIQSHSPHWTPCVCSDRSGHARALGAHVDPIELDWIDWMLRDRIQSRLQLNLPDLNLLIRKGCAEVGCHAICLYRECSI